MTLYFENECGAAFDFPLEETFKMVAKEVLRQENCPYDCEVSLFLVDEQGIRDANRDFRNIDKVTDVLSFPLLEYEDAGVFSEDILEDPEAFDPDTGELVLGDILICAERMRSQAEEYGHSLKREFAFLIAHSMLHLLGFDHVEPSEEEIMFRKQEQALKALNINR